MFATIILLHIIIRPFLVVSVPMTLWYDKPAVITPSQNYSNRFVDDLNWLTALPVGNGHLGAMMYGGVDEDRLQLNEKTLWSGSPSDSDNEDAFQHLVRFL